MKINAKDMITLIVPCYNEEESVELFINEIEVLKKEMNYIKFEIIYVDDGSRDNTLEKIKEISQQYKYVKYISFAKNFGKEYAMIAGLDASNGDYVAVIDADLQHPPQLLKEMYNLIKKGEYDCIAAKSRKRKYSFIRKTLTNAYYKIINSITEVEMKNSATDYRLMNRKMVNELIRHREHNRYLKGLFEITGFKVKWIEYEDNERVAGSTKWNISKLIKYAMTGIISFSQFPLMIILYIGIIMSFMTLAILILFVILIFLDKNINYTFWALFIIISFFSSIVVICNGIIAMYIAQIQTESKNRPLYIIREKNF